MYASTIEEKILRTLAELKVVQTLDERQARDGKLVLEIKATARGLIPELDQLIDMTEGPFEVTGIEDDGVSVSRFDAESKDTNIVSEQAWLITMQPKPDLPAKPDEFKFAAISWPDATMTYQRYVDADLVEVERVVELEQSYGQASLRWLWWTLAAVLLTVGAGTATVLISRRGQRTERQSRFSMPNEISPFTVLGLLRQIDNGNGLSVNTHGELRSEIDRLERHFFGNPRPEEPDLERIARDWLQQAS